MLCIHYLSAEGEIRCCRGGGAEGARRRRRRGSRRRTGGSPPRTQGRIDNETLRSSARAIPRTRELAETFAREAREAIAWLSDSPSKSALLELPDFVLSRLH